MIEYFVAATERAERLDKHPLKKVWAKLKGYLYDSLNAVECNLGRFSLFVTYITV
jgi:hypothetical protein